MRTIHLWSFLALILLDSGCNSRTVGEPLGHGYSREGQFICYDGKRVNMEVPKDLDFLKSFLGRELTIAKDVDAASFEALSSKYSKDQFKVYYRWTRGTKFWVVEIPGADPLTFKVLGLSLGMDNQNVWKQDRKVAGADARTTQVLDTNGRVWKDQNHVWFSGNIIQDADTTTFEALGDGFHYRDSQRVYWIFNVVQVVEGADPKTFKLNTPSLKDRK